ncbi:glucan endo-1,3-beta-glucosidase-like [Magnolia sinica]|uniref:glucan endo-1,3-beta-glucosidase-like n=1 Tax=Magnolia sinica TaxID=86752 RepID=UPI0026583901|nr:glucan endo-1,3-beta-glucosidase-like [Magnolia sinica]
MATSPNLYMAALFLLLGLLTAILGTGAQSIGVCYGMLGNNLPPVQEVVDLYKSLNIQRMRIYDPNQAALNALRGSNIDVIVGVPNDKLQEMGTNPSYANTWVDTYIKPYWPAVRFRYIAIGNEAIPGPNAQYILNALQNMYNAIARAGLNQIKISTAIHMAVLEISYPPSHGSFSAEAAQYLNSIISFINSRQAPLLANVYTYFSYADNPRDISLPYALFTSPGVVVYDGSLQYQNLFDAMVDALYSAVERVVGSNMEIVISESGWPSAGGFAATIGNAQTYNNNLIKHVGRGTPKRPGKAIETYIFAMFNENQKQPAGIEQNFGLFYPNKQPVYNINFTPSMQDDGIFSIISDVISF